MASNRSLGSLTLDLIAKIGGFNTGMDQAARSADKNLTDIEKRAYDFGRKIGDTFKNVAAVVGIGFTLDKFVDSVKESINQMDDLSKAAQRVGISTESFSSLAYGASLADVSIEDLQGSLGKLIKSQAAALDANSKQAKIFDALGISVKNADGTLRDSDEVFKAFADRFKDLKGSPEIIAAGMQIFGKSFQNIIPYIKDGAEGIRQAQEEAKDLNQVIGTETGEAAEAFNDNITRLQAAAHGVFNEVATNLLPVLEDWSNQMVETAKSGKNIEDTGDSLTQVIESLTVVVRAAAIIWDIFRGSVEAASNAAAAAKDIFHILTPQGIAETFGSIEGFKKNMGTLKTATQSSAQGISDAWQKSADDIDSHVKAISKTINGELLKGVFPTRNAKSQSSSFIDDIFGSDKDADAKAKAMADRLQGVLGNADANADKAKKKAEALADAYSKLFEAVQKTNENADPTEKAYNAYAQTVRNIAKLGGDVIEKGGDVIRVQNAVQEAVASAQKKLGEDLAAPMKAAGAFNDALAEQLQATKDLIDTKVAAVGMGSKEAANQNELANVYRQGTKAIADFQKQRELHPLSMTDEQYETELKGLKQYWSDVYDVTKTGQTSIDSAQSNWLNGVAKGWTDFFDEQSNNAQIAENLTRNFFDEASGDLADFLDGTKSAGDAFTDFVNNMEKDITEMVSKQLMKKLIASLIGGDESSGGGGGGGSMGSIFDLFSSDGFGFASGGSPSAHSVSRVNENGPELLSVGGRDYLMMGDQSGIVKPNRGATTGGGGRQVTQNNNYYLAAPTSMKTQTQIANRNAYDQRRAARLG
jgi:lambda family phage tail tape measure protein